MNYLPTKESQVKITSKLKKNPNGEPITYVILDSHDYLICKINITNPEDIANQIAMAVEDARDIGFEQGRLHIRKAMGIT